MCVTYERQSNICGHVASHKELCLEKKNQGVLKIFCPKCVPIRNRTNYYELCHDCRGFWQQHGISEDEATQRIRAYRIETNYFGPVSPHSFGGEDPCLMQDIDLNAKSRRRSTAAPAAEVEGQFPGTPSPLLEWLFNEGGTLDTDELPKGHEKDLTSWLVGQAMGDASSSSGESSPSSRLTLWPRGSSAYSEDARNKDKGKGKEKEKTVRKGGDVSSGPNYLPHPDEFQVHGVEPTPHPHDVLVDPNEFELETLEGEPRANIDKNGFERQELFALPPRRPIFGQSSRQGESSRQGARGQDPVKLPQFKPPPDLNKPLPRPPRRDSPMPGRPFDSQNPERDVPTNKYIPRAI